MNQYFFGDTVPVRIYKTLNINIAIFLFRESPALAGVVPTLLFAFFLGLYYT